MKKRILALVTAAALAVGTLSTGALAVSADEAAATADTIVIGRAYDSDNLDPVQMTGNYNIWIINLMLEGLVQTSDDGKTIEPLLATDWEISEDEKTYTFNLKPDVKFSDGTPVTGEDWVFSFERAISLPDSYWGFVVENVESVEAPDDSTFIVHLKEASPATLANLAMFTCGVQKKAYYDEVGDEGYMDGFIGTGPYVLTEWNKGESMLFTANPYYHIEGKPATPTLEMRVIADDESRVMQLQSGDIDAAINLSMDSVYQLESDDRVVAMASEGCETRFVAINTTNEYLSNPKVREALYMATDPMTITAVATYGYGIPSSTFLPMTSAYVDPEAVVNTADIEAAKALLEEAGYSEGDISLRLLITSGKSFEESVATLLKEQWAQIGVEVEIDANERTTYTDKLYGMDFDCVVDYWTDDTTDPYEFMNYICIFDLCSGFDTLYVVPGIEDLNAQANIEMNDEKRHEIYNEIQRKVAAEHIYIPICTLPYTYATGTSVTGFVQTPLGNLRLADMVKTVE